MRARILIEVRQHGHLRGCRVQGCHVVCMCYRVLGTLLRMAVRDRSGIKGDAAETGAGKRECGLSVEGAAVGDRTGPTSIKDKLRVNLE